MEDDSRSWERIPNRRIGQKAFDSLEALGRAAFQGKGSLDSPWDFVSGPVN